MGLVPEELARSPGPTSRRRAVCSGCSPAGRGRQVRVRRGVESRSGRIRSRAKRTSPKNGLGPEGSSKIRITKPGALFMRAGGQKAMTIRSGRAGWVRSGILASSRTAPRSTGVGESRSKSGHGRGLAPPGVGPDLEGSGISPLDIPGGQVSTRTLSRTRTGRTLSPNRRVLARPNRTVPALVSINGSVRGSLPLGVRPARGVTNLMVGRRDGGGSTRVIRLFERQLPGRGVPGLS